MFMLSILYMVDVHVVQSLVSCVVFCPPLCVYLYFLYSATDRIGVAMDSVLVSSAIDRVFEPRSGQTKDYKVVFISSQH